MVEHKRVQEVQETYARILEEYISRRFNQEPTLFARVVMKLTDLRNINEVHSKMLLKMKVDEFEPLLLEIFDLPTDAECVEKSGQATWNVFLTLVPSPLPVVLSFIFIIISMAIAKKKWW